MIIMFLPLSPPKLFWLPMSPSIAALLAAMQSVSSASPNLPARVHVPCPMCSCRAWKVQGASLEDQCVGKWYKQKVCKEITCRPPTGACCNPRTGLCEDRVLQGSCPSFASWTPNITCGANGFCTGACCNTISGDCSEVLVDLVVGACFTGQNPTLHAATFAHYLLQYVQSSWPLRTPSSGPPLCI